MSARPEEKERRRQDRVQAERAYVPEHLDLDFDRHFNRVIGLTKFGMIAGVVITILFIILLIVLILALV